MLVNGNKCDDHGQNQLEKSSHFIRTNCQCKYRVSLFHRLPPIQNQETRQEFWNKTYLTEDKSFLDKYLRDM